MQKLFLIGVILCCAFTLSYAEPNQKIEMIKPEIHSEFEVLEQDMVFGSRQYRLFIAVPKEREATETLPVLYLLDGNAHFPIAMNALNSTKKRAFVVGIGYLTEQAYDIEQRTRDYTYRAVGSEFKNGGQAADFMRFIQIQVKPYIEQKYLIDLTEQHFFGHSFGGLFGLYVLFNQPDLFNTYTIASPSLWWGNASIIPNSEFWIEKSPKQINIVLGEYEESPQNNPDITAERLVKIKERQSIYPARKLAQELQKQSYKVEFILIPKKDHGGVISDAIKVAIENIP